MQDELRFLNAQISGMMERQTELAAKIAEFEQYRDGNPRNAILVNYWDGPDGGFQYGVYDLVYVGEYVRTKYGAIVKVTGYDKENELLTFEGHSPLGPSRISQTKLSVDDYNDCRTNYPYLYE